MVRTLLVLLLGTFLACLAGCDAHAADKEEMQSVVDRLDEANESGNGQAAAALVTAESIARYGPVLKLGLDGKRKEIEALDAWDMTEVFLMRTLSKRKDLKDLDARGYVVYATSKKWYATGDSTPTELRRIRLLRSGDEATARVYYDGEYSGAILRFLREDGVWKLDENSWRGTFNRYIAEMASESEVSIPEAIMQMIEEERGTKPPPTVWNPMR